MPELGKSINQAIEESRSNPQDEKKALYALQLLEKAVPRYDCRRSYDYEPIPAWWMADYRVIDDWIEYMYKKVLDYNKYALKVYVEYLNTSDGYIAEWMDRSIWGILIGSPLFILENWDSIKDLKERVLGSVFMASLGSDVQLINTYQKIAEENPIYRPTCEEIIDTIKKLLKKVPSTVQYKALSTAHSLHSF
jgi:hypothetical protein